MTPDPIAYLWARLNDEEVVAFAADTPEARTPWGDKTLQPVPPERMGDQLRGYLGGTLGEHSAQWTPTRVLAEIAAKRALLAWVDSLDALDQADVVGMMLYPFRDRPDFDPAWRP